MKNRTLLPRPVLFILTFLGFLFAIDLFTLAAYRELDQTIRELDRHERILEALQPLPTLMLGIQSGLRGFLLTGSSASLNQYRAAADQLPATADKALALIGEEVAHRQLVADAAVSAKQWLDQYASPLVVKRSAGDDGEQGMKATIEALRNGQGEHRAEQISGQFLEAIALERTGINGARIELQRKFDHTQALMLARAAALLLTLAALALVFSRAMARLAGQRQSRKLAESAMRTSSATMRAMSEASPLGMFLADASGACVQSNVAFERIAGLSASQLLGSGWQSTLHAQDREQVLAAWRQFITQGSAFNSTHRFVHRGGQVVWASMKSASMRDGGGLLGFACSVEDVSAHHQTAQALRKSEEHLRHALESSGLAIFEWHIASGEVSLSGEWNALTGYDWPELTTTARRVGELIHPQDRDGLRDEIVGAFKTDKPIRHARLHLETRSGQWLQIHCNARVTERDSFGRAVRMTGTIKAAG